MAYTYTNFVNSLTNHQENQNESLLEETWSKLRTDVRREIARRGLTNMPPSVLGISATCWQNAMDDLLQEFFLYIFVKRQKNLCTKLQNSEQGNIEGIVTLQIRHCLTHLQRQNDPIGYRVYELLLSAIKQSVDQGELINLSNHTCGRISNHTLLGFSQRISCQQEAKRKAASKALSSDSSNGFSTQAHTWLDELLPEMMIARSRQVTVVVQRLQGLVHSLRDEGVEEFRFKDLVDPLKTETRRRWLATWGDAKAQEESLGAKSSLRNAADLYGLNRCVSSKIDLEQKKKTREDLARTWFFLRATETHSNGHRLSAVKLSREVGVDRSRVPKLLGTLKCLVVECLSAQSPSSQASDQAIGGRS